MAKSVSTQSQIALKSVVQQLLTQEHTQSVIRWADRVLTYAELILLAQQAATFLQKQGVQAGSRVLLSGARDLKQCIFMIACFILRAAYVPVRQGCSHEELHFVEQLTGACCVLTDKKAALKGIVYPSLSELAALVAYPLDAQLDLEQEAYVLFTSGTTKQPKAVSITHRQLSTVLAAVSEHIVIGQKDILSAIHSFCFDFSIWELWYALIHGAGLYIADQNELNNLEHLLACLAQYQVSVLSATPSVFYNLGLLQTLNHYDLSSLHHIVFGGETLKKFHLDPWQDHEACYHNLYGATESTIHATYIQIFPNKFEDQKGSAIGRPLKHYFIKIVDSDGMPSPPHVSGELLLRGPAVIEHYLHDHHLEKFVDLEEEGERRRYFRTGDFAHYDEDGQLYFDRRANDHAKIRGFRVDVERVQEEMNALDSIAQAHVNVANIEEKDCLVALVKTTHPYFDGLKKYQDTHVWMTLPNGIQIAYQTQAETQFLFKEIFEQQQYWHPQVRLPDNPILVDVGANIGLFMVALKMTYPQARIHCIEPAPEPYAKLKINAELFGPEIEAHCFAIGKDAGTVEMTYYPEMSIMSGSHATYATNLEWLVQHAQTLAAEVTETVSTDDLQAALATKLVSKTLTVKQKTLSQFMQMQQLERIDLLKIDVESAEWEVLQGLETSDWHKIQNIVIEISLEQSSEQACVALVQAQGFETQIVRSPEMEAFRLGYLWGWRSSSFPRMRSLSEPDSHAYHLPRYIAKIKQELSQKLPDYAIPAHIALYHHLPVNRNGKIDFTSAWPSSPPAPMSLAATSSAEEAAEPDAHQALMHQIKQVFYATLAIDPLSDFEQATFFDLGANSLLMIKLYHQLVEKIPACRHLKLVDLFNHPSFKKLTHYLLDKQSSMPILHAGSAPAVKEKIAIIGFSALFPESPDHEAVWQHLCAGNCLIKSYTAAELAAWKVASDKINHPFFVPASALVEGMYEFDASFFNYTQKDAVYLDPQQRVCLQQTYQAILNAGYAPEHLPGTVGVYLGSGRSNHEHHIFSSSQVDPLLDGFALELLNEGDYLATRVAYHYGFTGPAINVHNACATSTAAIIMACDQLRLKKCDVAIAGGVYLKLLNECGYIAKPESTFSPTGVCNPFSAQADGLVPGSGCGIFVLKRLEQTIQDGDEVKAVIAGYALNNDGGDRIAFSALSLSGQIRCIQDALLDAQLSADDIDYVETHGTGTRMGDDLEMRALETIFGERKDKPLYLGAAKANFGHADAASGALSLVKGIHLLQENKIPPHIYSPTLDPDQHYVFNPELLQPPAPLKFSAINSFGLGGTNCHLILSAYEPSQRLQIRDIEPFNGLFIAAHTHEALVAYAQAFLQRLQTLSPFNREDWYSITWLSRRNQLKLPYKVVILADCCLNAITQLKQVGLSQKTGVYALERTPKNLYELARQWVQDAAVDLSVFGDKPGRCMPLPPYPFAKTIYQFESFLPTQAETRLVTDATTRGQLLAIVQHLTGHHSLEPHESFFEIGMDSMHGLDLITRIQDQFKLKLVLDDFYQYSSVEKLAQQIDLRMEANASVQDPLMKKRAQLVTMQELAEDSPRIVLIPPTNGMLYWYRDLVDALSGTVLGIQYDNSDIATDYASIAEFALHYCDTLLSSHIKQKLVLVGWSLGGNIAHDMGQFLALMNYPIQGVVMIDSYAKYQIVENEAYYQAQYAEQQTREGSATWQVLWKRSASLASSYRPTTNTGVETCLIRAQNLLPEYMTLASSDNLWGPYIASEKLTIVEYGTDHMSIIRQEHAALVAQTIKTFIDKR